MYIQQEDLLFAQLTVKETLTLSDKLKTPDHTATQRTATVDRLAAMLSLKNVMNTKVGDAKTRGTVLQSFNPRLPWGRTVVFHPLMSLFDCLC